MWFDCCLGRIGRLYRYRKWLVLNTWNLLLANLSDRSSRNQTVLIAGLIDAASLIGGAVLLFAFR